MLFPHSRVVLSLFLATAILGCGGAAYEGQQPAYDATGDAVVDSSASMSASPDTDAAGDINLVAYQPDSQAGAAEAPQAATQDPARAARKVIHTATLDIVVEQFDDIPARIDELASKNGGFISKANVDTAEGRSRHGTWTIRVPVDRYRAFMNAAGTIGILQRGVEDSREVTAEYYDLESRARNKEREEARLLEHLDQLGGNLQQVLIVEKELSRVRLEVEQIAGQLRVLKDVSALSTVTINVSEVEEYVPPQSPTFTARVESTWSNSLGALTALGQVFVLAAVALAPWALVAVVPMLLALAIYRVQRRTKAAA
jgi:hypothetical protein